MSVSFAVGTPIPGELVIPAANVWTQLSGTSKPCTKIRLSAPTPSSPKGSVNAKSVLVCESVTQPATTAGAWELPPTATGLNYTHVRDATLVWVYALNAGDAVEYSIQ